MQQQGAGAVRPGRRSGADGWAHGAPGEAGAGPDENRRWRERAAKAEYAAELQRQMQEHQSGRKAQRDEWRGPAPPGAPAVAAAEAEQARRERERKVVAPPLQKTG
jgi:hypothetical protein